MFFLKCKILNCILNDGKNIIQKWCFDIFKIPIKMLRKKKFKSTIEYCYNWHSHLKCERNTMHAVTFDISMWTTSTAEMKRARKAKRTSTNQPMTVGLWIPTHGQHRHMYTRAHTYLNSVIPLVAIGMVVLGQISRCLITVAWEALFCSPNQRNTPCYFVETPTYLKKLIIQNGSFSWKCGTYDKIKK